MSRTKIKPRSRTRSRKRTAPAVRQLQEQALAVIGFSKNAIAKWKTPPTIAVHFGIVEHGYEMQIFVDGHYLGTTDRDFSGNHKISELKGTLIEAIAKAVNTWRLRL